MYLSTTAKTIFKAKLKTAEPGEPLFEYWARGSAERDLKAAWKRARRDALEKAKRKGRVLTGWPERISFNDLRRTFCSAMTTAGVPMQHCAELMGHASSDMVQFVYARLAPDSLHAAVDMLPGLDVTAASNKPRASKPPKLRLARAA
jgi:integrase